MPAPFYGSSSQLWSQYVDHQISLLRELADRLGDPKLNREQFLALGSQMKREIASLNAQGQRWAKEDLLTDYRSAFHELAVPPIPKSYSDRAYRQRQKAKLSVENLGRNLNAWSDSVAHDAAMSKQASFLHATKRKLELGIQNARRDKTPQVSVNKMKQDLAGVYQQIRELPDTTASRGYPGVRYIASKGPHKGSTYKFVNADEYARMVAETHHRLTQNLGNLAALSKGKRQYVYVTDGVGCGWKSHNDPLKADGRRVLISEALGAPLAHPHCQRTFWPEKPTGPPAVPRAMAVDTSGKVTRENIAKAIEQLARDEVAKRPRTMADIFAFAGKVGMAVYRVQVVARNPIVRRMAIGILEDAEGQLPPAAEQFIKRLVGYDASDALALRAYGRELGVATQAELQQRVMADTDTALAQHLGAEALEEVEIPEHVRIAMRLPKNPTRDQVIGAYKDYYDYHEYLKASERAWWENLEEKVLRMRAVDATVGQQGEGAALQLHLSNPTSERLNTSWRILIRSTSSTAAKNKEYLRRELIKSVAELVPGTFRGKTLGPLKFTIGLSQKGRIDLATKLYDQVRGGIRWTAEDVAWAEQLGLHLPAGKNIAREDVIKALLPRLTFEPGPLFNATVALEQGKLVPLFRAYPPGTWRKWLAMDMRLRSGTLEHIFRDLRTAHIENSLDRETIQKILHGFTDDQDKLHPGLLDETITNFWFWKDGPLEGNLRFYGAHIAQYGASLQPDSGLVRIAHKFKASTPTLAYFDKKLGEETFYLDEDGNIVRFGSHQSDLNVLPNFGGGLHLQLRDGNFTTAMMHFHIFHGNLMGVSKDTRYGYDQLLNWWADIQERVGDYRKIVTRAEISSIRTWEDFTRFVQEINFRTRSVHQEYKAGAAATELLDLVSEADLQKMHPALIHDLQEWQNVMRATHPNMDLPRWRIVSSTQEHELMFRNGEILIREDAARNWIELQRLRSKGVDVGLFPAGTYDRVANLYHEQAHAAIEQMTVTQYRRLWGRIGASLGPEDHWPGGTEGENFFPFTDLRESFEADSKDGVRTIISVWMARGSRLSVAQKDLPNRPAGTAYYTVGAIRRKILRNLSGYAARSPDEFIAEAWMEWMTSPNPRPIARAVGLYFNQTFSGRLRLVHPSMA